MVQGLSSFFSVWSDTDWQPQNRKVIPQTAAASNRFPTLILPPYAVYETELRSPGGEHSLSPVLQFSRHHGITVFLRGKRFAVPRFPGTKKNTSQSVFRQIPSESIPVPQQGKTSTSGSSAQSDTWQERFPAEYCPVSNESGQNNIRRRRS